MTPSVPCCDVDVTDVGALICTILGCDVPGVATLTICVEDIMDVEDVEAGVKVEKLIGFAVSDGLFTSIFPVRRPAVTEDRLLSNYLSSKLCT